MRRNPFSCPVGGDSLTGLSLSLPRSTSMIPPDAPDLPLEPDDRFPAEDPRRPAPRSRRSRSSIRPASGGSPTRLRASPVLLMAQHVYDEILEQLTWPPETFGLLLGPRQQDHVVTHFL